MSNVNKVKKINCKIEGGDSFLPQYESSKAAGMDIKAWKYSYTDKIKEELDFSEEGFVLKPNKRILIKTGLYVELPENIEMQVRPRSGLALKNGITVVNAPGTVDEDYRGNVGVILLNTGEEDFVIKKGDRIGQIVFNKVEKFDFVISDELSQTKRGECGFGSTGTSGK